MPLIFPMNRGIMKTYDITINKTIYKTTIRLMPNLDEFRIEINGGKMSFEAKIRVSPRHLYIFSDWSEWVLYKTSGGKKYAAESIGCFMMDNDDLESFRRDIGTSNKLRGAFTPMQFNLITEVLYYSLLEFRKLYKSEIDVARNEIKEEKKKQFRTHASRLLEIASSFDNNDFSDLTGNDVSLLKNMASILRTQIDERDKK